MAQGSNLTAWEAVGSWPLTAFHWAAPSASQRQSTSTRWDGAQDSLWQIHVRRQKQNRIGTMA